MEGEEKPYYKIVCNTLFDAGVLEQIIQRMLTGKLMIMDVSRKGNVVRLEVSE